MEVAGAVDAGDLEPISVSPLPSQQRVLDAFGALGSVCAPIRAATCASGRGPAVGPQGARRRLRLFELIVLSDDGGNRSRTWQWVSSGRCVRRTLIDETRVAAASSG